MRLDTVLAFFSKVFKTCVHQVNAWRWVRFDLASQNLGADMGVLIALSRLADCACRHSRRLSWWRAWPCGCIPIWVWAGGGRLCSCA